MGFIIGCLHVLSFRPSLSSIPLPQHGPLTHKHLFYSLTLGCAREYSWVDYVLAPFFFAPTSFDTISIFTALHLEANGYFPLFLEYYELDQNLELSFDSFKLMF